jgi:Flp pilus assembly protein TadG
MLKRRMPARRGAALVEVAIIVPLFIFLIAIAADVVSGVYRFQQVATLARTGARYAAVHAGMYAQEWTTSVVTADTLKQNVILPQSFNLNTSLLTCNLSWLPSGNSYPYYDSTDTGVRKYNMVRVELNYSWQPIFLFGSPLTLTSRSEMTISY